MLLFGVPNPEDAVEKLNKDKASNHVACTTIFRENNEIWICETCGIDRSSMICKDCFEPDKHRGHKAFLKRNIGGRCNCGESDICQESGFCEQHKGYANSIDGLLDNLPSFVKKSEKYVFRHVFLQLKIACMQLQVAI